MNENDITISKQEHEQFMRALTLCSFIVALDTPRGKIARQTITLQKLIDKANIVCEEIK